MMLSKSTIPSLLGLALLCGTTGAQASNDCSSAQAISGTGGFGFDNSSATQDGGSLPGCPTATRDVWFAWTAPTSEFYEFSTCGGATFDTVLAAYDGTSCGSSPVAACNDDTCGLQSRIAFTTVASSTYLIRIGSYPGEGGGTGTLTIDLAGPDPCGMPATGPDVIVGELPSVGNYGGSGGFGGYSIGTTSCNIGTAELQWIAGNNQHPVIGQNFYRLENGRFEQIGLSWLKHGFTALQESLCCNCTSSGTGTRLGVGCSDPYSSGLNGSQGGLGPRFEVNAHSGLYSYPFTGAGQTGNATYKRIRVDNQDLNPTNHPSALYFGEGHYIAMDDALAGNGNNNASYVPLQVGSFSGGAWVVNTAGATVREQPAIMAWQANDANVQIENVQVPNEGLFLVGSNATDNGNGTWHYEYAIHNLNSDVSGGSFTVPAPASVTVTNMGFHDVDYHSGEPFDGTDWVGVRNANSVSWSTDSFATDPDANALRWGTLYNFRFDADVAPAAVVADLGFFKPHTPSSVGVSVSGPECGSIAAAETVRVGSPPNASALLIGQTSGPVIGATWDPVIDHTSFFPGAIVDVLNISPNAVNVPLAFGTLLCSLGGDIFFALPSTPFSIAIPDQCGLVGRSLCAQGGAYASGQLQLTNAIDLVLGSL